MSSAVVERFMAYAREEAATVQRINGLAEVPDAVAAWLGDQQLAGRIHVRGSAAELDWSRCGLHELQGDLAPDGDTVVTGCYAGIAEIGAVVMIAADRRSAVAHYLAATHIVVIHSQTIVGTYEALWPKLRGDFGDEMPRTVNFVVGPSRTADLGVPSKLGAHGPVRVHIIVVGVD